MTERIDLDSEVTLTLKCGHAFLLWHVVANLGSETNFMSVFSDVEKKAVWAFEDQLENKLASYNLTYTDSEFEQIKKKWDDYVANKVDADFL
jgi:hypothetical protein